MISYYINLVYLNTGVKVFSRVVLWNITVCNNKFTQSTLNLGIMSFCCGGELTNELLPVNSNECNKFGR